MNQGCLSPRLIAHKTLCSLLPEVIHMLISCAAGPSLIASCTMMHSNTLYSLQVFTGLHVTS